MTKTGKLRFTVEYIEDETVTKQVHEVKVNESEVEQIDELEQVLLKLGKEGMRKFMSQQLSLVSKKTH